MTTASAARMPCRASVPLAAAIFLTILILGANTAWRAGLGRDADAPRRTDVYAFMAGGQALSEGRSPFGAVDAHGWAYVYPPAAAAIFAAMRPIGEAAPIAWYALSVAVFGWGIASIRGALAPRAGTALEAGLPLALVALPAASALLRGQMGPLLAGLVAVGAARMATRRDFSGGLALGAATALKATPALAIAALVVMRRPRAVCGAIVALALLLVLAPAPFLGLRGALLANADFVRSMVVRYARDPASAGMTPGSSDYAIYGHDNQSLLALGYEAGLGGTAAFLPFAIAVVVAAIAAALFPAARVKGGDRSTRVVAAIGLAAAVSLLAAPVAWHHHHVILYPALAAVVTEAARARTPRRGTWVALGVFGALELLHFAVPPLRPIGLLGVGSILPLLLAGRLAVRSADPGADRPPEAPATAPSRPAPPEPLTATPPRL